MTDKQTSLFPKDPDSSETVNILRGLDRAEVEPFASKIVSTIEHHCIRVEVAGSIRRHKPTVNDIDLVIQPKSNAWLQIIKAVRREFGAITEKQGQKLATLYVPFTSTQGQGLLQTWGILLLIRTGSAEHNIYLAKLARRRGYRLAYSKGLLNEEGEILASETERDVFQALGLDYIPPEERELQKE